MAKHILQAAPNSAKVIFENEVVRVIEITMKKGQKVPMHQHRKGLGYSLNSGKIRSTREDGRSEVVNVKRGEVSWEERAYSHAVDNLGATLTELSFEFKSQ